MQLFEVIINASLSCDPMSSDSIHTLVRTSKDPSGTCQNAITSTSLWVEVI